MRLAATFINLLSAKSARVANPRSKKINVPRVSARCGRSRGTRERPPRDRRHWSGDQCHPGMLVRFNPFISDSSRRENRWPARQRRSRSGSLRPTGRYVIDGPNRSVARAQRLACKLDTALRRLSSWWLAEPGVVPSSPGNLPSQIRHSGSRGRKTRLTARPRNGVSGVSCRCLAVRAGVVHPQTAKLVNDRIAADIFEAAR